MTDTAKPQIGMCAGCLMHSVTLFITSREWSAHSKQMAHRAAHSELVWVRLLIVNCVDVCKRLYVYEFLEDKMEIKKNEETCRCSDAVRS